MTDLDDDYWAGAERGELLVQRCLSCGLKRFPPSPYCNACLSSKFEWEVASGDGRIWSWIRMHRVYYKDFADKVPYNVALVELAEGPFVMSSIVGEGSDRLVCDAAVRLRFERDGEGRNLPVFELVD